MIRVALFHTTLPEPGRKVGGVEVVAHRLANALVMSGNVDVKVYSLTDAPAGALYRHERLYKRAPWLATNYLCRMLLLPFLLNFVNFEAAQVMHLHGDDWFYVLRRIPTVRTFHGSALLEARSARPHRKLEWYFVYLFERLAARLSKISLAIGDSAKELYHAAYQVDNGIDSTMFRPGRKTERPQIVYVGTWKGRKRGEFLFELFLKEVLPAVSDAMLCFVGDFCPSHPNVVFRKNPSDVELASYYRESWIFAYPSLYEGFGNIYLEALASGTAIVSSPNEGARRILKEGTFGVIANDDEFASRLNALLASDKDRECFEQAGRQQAKKFSWSSIAKQHQDIYQEAMR